MPGVSDEDLLDWVNKVYYVAGALAAFFTVVTIVSGYMQFKLNERISERKDRALAKYQSDASLQIAVANEKAKEAGKSAADAVLRAAQLDKETARLTAENLRLQSQLMWRTLSKSQASAILAAAMPFKGQHLQIVSVMGDADGKQFGQQIAQVLRDAGWQCGDSDVYQAMFKQIPTGVSVHLNPIHTGAGETPPAVLQLVALLSNVHVISRMQAVRNDEVPPKAIRILVGVKEPFQSGLTGR